MELLVGIVIGVVAATVATLGVEEPTVYVPVPVRRPPSIRTLGGHLRRYVVIRPRSLPVRVPGAALIHNPVPLPGDLIHVTVKSRWRTLVDRFVAWLRDVIAAEPDAAFQLGLQHSLEEERRRQTVHGRHRLEELRGDPSWRTRWAMHDTQSWPTLEMNPFDDTTQRCRDRYPVKYLEPDAPAVRADEVPLPVA